MRRRWLSATLAVVLVLAGVSCRRKAGATSDAGEPAPLVVSDATEGLLLTWIDDKGDFHVEQKVGDVPLVGRDVVRVVDPNRDDGTHPDRIFVADLRNAGPDGSYPVRVTTRAEFDAIAEGRRQKNGPTLASVATGADGGGLPSAPQQEMPGTLPDPSAAARPAVIIYGASWCGACHQAAAYLRKKGIAFVEKDIEADANAAREMRAKLSRVGLHAGSIPVLDVRGKVMVGFNPQEVDAALGDAL